MDRHELVGASAADIAQAHAMDVAAQAPYGVEYVTYWFDYSQGHGFCLARGPDQETVERVHRESHGQVASEIIAVDDAVVGRFMGGIPTHPVGEVYEDSAFRAILFTDLVGSTDLTQRLGDSAAMNMLRRHDAIVREAIDDCNGSEVKHTGDGIMASFRSVGAALRAGVAIQRGFDEATKRGEMPCTVRVGIAAGEPVAEADDLFGAAVQLAARLTGKARPGTILVSAAVRDLALGKGFQFTGVSAARIKGFVEPVRVAEVVWAT